MRYFIEERGEARGPYTIGQLRSMWAAGHVTGEMSYRPEGVPDDQWMPLRVLGKELEPSPVVPAAAGATSSPAPKWSFGRALLGVAGGLGIAATLAIVVACIAFPGTLRPAPKWEYHLMHCLAIAPEDKKTASRSGTEALWLTAVEIDPADLAKLGAEGWELAGSYLEMQTAFPNFGKEDYVTGLQPNVRPQRAVLIFKRPARS